MAKTKKGAPTSTIPSTQEDSTPPASKEVAPKSASTDDSTWAPAKAQVVVSRLRARWPSLSTDERAAFDSLSTDAQRSALGSRTKARGVASDAMRWAAAIDRQLSEYAVLREHYDPKRFAYFLERVEVLVNAIGKQGSRRNAQGDTRTDAGAAMTNARAARNKLILVLGRVAGKRETDLAHLANARGDTESDDNIVVSMKRLLKLASRWLKTGTPFLLSTARLTPALVADVTAAYEALTNAGADATEVGSGRGNDSPAVNVFEGWVLEEMQRARTDVDAAREDSPVIERLIPGPATRAVIGGHPRKADSTHSKDVAVQAPAPKAEEAPAEA